MKRNLSIGLMLVVLILAAIGAIPVFAHSPDDDSANPDGNGGQWAAMHEACEDGDWEAMAEAAEAAHGEDFDSMPGHNYDGFEDENNGLTSRHGDMMGGGFGGMTGSGWGGMGGHMGSGISYSEIGKITEATVNHKRR